MQADVHAQADMLATLVRGSFNGSNNVYLFAQLCTRPSLPGDRSATSLSGTRRLAWPLKIPERDQMSQAYTDNAVGIIPLTLTLHVSFYLIA